MGLTVVVITSLHRAPSPEPPTYAERARHAMYDLVWPSTPSLAAFLGVVAAVVAAWIGVHAFAFPERRLLAAGLAAVAAVGWLAITAAVSASGMLEQAMVPPPAFLFFGSLLATALGIGLSPLGRRLAFATPIWALVGFQGFRLPLELVLHTWAEQGTIPPQMTWTGQNWDVVTGLLSLIVAPIAWRWPKAGWVGAVVGSVLLLEVLRVVVLSVPGPLRAFPGPTLNLVFHAPFVWIGAVLVFGALLGHVLAFRALLRR